MTRRRELPPGRSRLRFAARWLSPCCLWLPGPGDGLGLVTRCEGGDAAAVLELQLAGGAQRSTGAVAYRRAAQRVGLGSCGDSEATRVVLAVHTARVTTPTTGEPMCDEEVPDAQRNDLLRKHLRTLADWHDASPEGAAHLLNR
jgi:hypothetical protein